MRNRIRLGFIGCGGHSARHADVVRKMPDSYKIVGALDVQQNTAEKFLGTHDKSALATTDISKFLVIEGMDAVIIATPHKYH